MNLPDVITAMLQPEFYVPRPENVTLVQTHISYVLVAGDEVFKVKKPVRFSFLDFSTLEQRRHFCQEEVRLNRRLAGDVYRGVVAICGANGGYRLAAADDPAAVEYAVRMRRLPAERLLDRLLDQGLVTATMIDAIAARLVEFHRDADTGSEIAAQGDPAAILRVLEDNYANAAPFRGRTIAAADDDAIQAFARRFLRDNAELLRRRQQHGCIRDGHGDLHTEHVCVSEPLAIFDCVEFNPRLRYVDVASDIAFLAMDLDYHQRADLAARLVARYAALTDDAELTHLVPFYQCARAYVRGQVDSMKSAEDDVAPDDRAAAHTSAKAHFALAYRYTWAYSPCVVAIAGLSGTGKSTLAAALHDRTGFTHIGSDLVRKALSPPRAPDGSADAGELYAPEQRARTYAAMLQQAEGELAAGRGVILDATFQHRADRAAVRALAQPHGLPLLFIECRADPALARQRIEARQRLGSSPSDATWSVYLEQQKRYEAFTPEEDPEPLVVNTDADPASIAATVEQALRQCLRPETPPT